MPGIWGDQARALAREAEHTPELEPQARAMDDSAAAFLEHQTQTQFAREADKIEDRHAAAPRPTVERSVEQVAATADRSLRVVSNIVGGVADKLTDMIDGKMNTPH